MPSTRNPVGLGAGPGRLPANVVTASALTAPVPAADAPDTDFSVVSVSGATQLPRRGRYLTVLVTAGTYTITLPTDPEVGDMVTFLVTGGSGLVTIRGHNVDRIHSFTTEETLGTGTFAARSFVCTDPEDAWAAFSEKPVVQELSSSTTLTRAGATQLVLVDTVGGNVSVTLPQRSQVGDRITFIKVGGTNVLTVVRFGGSDVIDGGLTQVDVTANQISTTLVRTSPTPSAAWTTVAESTGLVENFYSLARADTRSDVNTGRLRTTPMFNWSQRRVALHAEFAGLITNVLPVDGFSAGGEMRLSSVPGVPGTVGVMRCTVPLGKDGYIHLGSSPTAKLFDPVQLMGFRAILTLQTPNVGTDYDVILGFGDDISADLSADHSFGQNGLYLWTEQAGNWRRTRQNSGTSSGTTMSAATPGSRVVLEYYNSGTGWDAYINGVRSAGGALTNVPTAMLNFGMLIVDDGGGSTDFVVDVDSFTIFTHDMGATRHDP